MGTTANNSSMLGDHRRAYRSVLTTWYLDMEMNKSPGQRSFEWQRKVDILGRMTGGQDQAMPTEAGREGRRSETISMEHRTGLFHLWMSEPKNNYW